MFNLKQFLFFFIISFIFFACAKKGVATVMGTPPLPNTFDKTDTLKVVAYNVLNYGDGCQGSLSILNNEFKTIIAYLDPDILSCEKTDEFDPLATGSFNLAFVIRDSVLNAVFQNRYAYVTPTNFAGDDAMNCLFYNKQKLVFVSNEILLIDISDFDLCKFYYNDPNLTITRDTTFLYLIINHTKSGSSSADRDQQLSDEMQALRGKFSYLPNLINLGDFNTNNSFEAGYQAIITSNNAATAMSDPPFYPDNKISYPAYWTNDASQYGAYLTTSTRQSATAPNSCGTDGGAKSWYDHIFISPWLANGTNYMSYISNSYQTIGNDGNRLGQSINSDFPFTNTSVPQIVTDALFQFSNKYPVSIQLKIKANRSGMSTKDPVEN